MKGNRLTIAYITTIFGRDMINHQIWTGIYNKAEQMDVNICCLPAATSNSPNMPHSFARMRNSLFNIVTHENFDGLLIWGGGMWGNKEPGEVEELYSRLSGFPAVNLSMVRKGMTSVTIDNYTGMYELCSHFIELHGCKRLAFIKGPEGHDEAAQRFKAYKDSLENHSIKFNPKLVTEGDYLRTAGERAVNVLLDERKTKPDAVIAASDLMAFGAIAELEKRNIKIPDQIKIGGFDDLEESIYHRFPLSTVRQPFQEMGAKSLEILIDILNGKKVSKTISVPSKLVIRESCGCENMLEIDTEIPFISEQKHDTSDKHDFPVKQISEKICKELDPLDEKREILMPAVKSLVESAALELSGGNAGVFLDNVKEEMDKQNTSAELGLFVQIIVSIKIQLTKYLEQNSMNMLLLEIIFYRIQSAVCQHSQKILRTESLKNELGHDILNEISRLLIGTFEIDGIIKIAAANFPRLGIENCYMAFYTEPAELPDKVRLVFALKDGEIINISEEERHYKMQDILPSVLLDRKERFALFLDALYFENTQIGFIIFGEKFIKSLIYRKLQAQMSVAVRGALLSQEKEKLLFDIERRADELQLITERLKESNEELEQFSYFASHDLKEPLRKVKVFSERLQTEFRDSLGESGTDYLSRMNKAVDRMLLLIKNLLNLSRITTNAKPFESVKIKDLIGNVLNDLEIIIEQKKAVIETGDFPEIEADANQMQQLFLNIISNALKFQKKGTVPHVKIHSKTFTLKSADYCEIIIEDNGIGIKSDDQQRIFDAFSRVYSQKEYEGSGIGLAICKKVAARHHGNIRVESEYGRGTKFIIDLPLLQKHYRR